VVGQPSRRFTATLERAYRRACRVGITEVGTDLVFYEVATELLALDGLLPHALHRLWRPVRKGRAGLTDPRPSTVLHEVFLAEDVRFEADAVLRQAAFAGSSSVRVRSDREGVRPSFPASLPATRRPLWTPATRVH
jgi:hypothetical protein